MAFFLFLLDLGDAFLHDGFECTAESFAALCNGKVLRLVDDFAVRGVAGGGSQIVKKCGGLFQKKLFRNSVVHERLLKLQNGGNVKAANITQITQSRKMVLLYPIVPLTLRKNQFAV